MKNTVYAIVIVVCFAAAGIIAYKYIFTSGSGGGIDDISAAEKTWVKCNNPECKAEYEMGLREYHKFIKANMVDPMAMVAPPLICKTCGKASVFRAEKCGNPDCGIVFFSGSVPNDFADRCPECGRSEDEEIRKARKREREAGGTG